MFFLVFGIIAFGVTCSRCSKEIKDVNAKEDKIMVHLIDTSGNLNYYQIEDGITWNDFLSDNAELISNYDLTVDEEGYLYLDGSMINHNYDDVVTIDDRVKPGYYGVMSDYQIVAPDESVINRFYYFLGMNFEQLLDLYEFYKLSGYGVKSNVLNVLENLEIKFYNGEKRLFICDYLVENPIDSKVTDPLVYLNKV